MSRTFTNTTYKVNFTGNERGVTAKYLSTFSEEDPLYDSPPWLTREERGLSRRVASGGLGLLCVATIVVAGAAVLGPKSTHSYGCAEGIVPAGGGAVAGVQNGARKVMGSRYNRDLAASATEAGQQVNHVVESRGGTLAANDALTVCITGTQGFIFHSQGWSVDARPAPATRQ